MRQAAVLVPLAFILAAAPTLSEPREGSFILSVACNGPDGTLAAMEFSYSAPTCWNHTGLHTYFVGRDTTYLLRHVEGLAFSVEQEFSAPTEGLSPGAGLDSAYGAEVHAHSPLVVETSLDGLAWSIAGTGTYRYLDTDELLDWHGCVPSCRPLESLYRQNVLFDITAEGQEFRFLRVRQPASLATQGLSGFLDYSRFILTLDQGNAIASPSLAPGTRELACEQHILEDIFALHPCWYGGVDRYDSPSFFHTYALGGAARLDAVRGTYTALPWRLDDWYQPGITADDLLLGITLQSSADGQAWTNLTKVSALLGEGTFEVTGLGGLEATFVRIVPEPHNRFWQFQQFAPNHHPEAYLLDSAIHVEGLLPS